MQCNVSYSKPEGALAQKTLDVHMDQTHAAIAVAQLNKKQKRFLLMEREDNKRLRKYMVLCVVFQVIFR